MNFLKIFYEFSKKRVPKSFLVLVIFCFFTVIAKKSDSNNEIDEGIQLNQLEQKIELERAEKLNSILDRELLHLDEINSVLQYLGQAIYKGAISVQNKTLVQEWIRNNQKIIKDLSKSHTTLPLMEKDLYDLVCATSLLTIHITNALKNRFQEIKKLKIVPNRKKENVEIEIESIKEKLDSNNRLIKHLRIEANQAGLSTVNKIARRIDNIMDELNLVPFFDNLPAFMVLGATALYFIPRHYIDGIGITGLSKLKQWLGTSSYTDPTPEELEERNKNQKKNPGSFDKLLELIKSKDYKALGTVTALIPALMSKEPLHPFAKILRDKVGRSWDKLKGFTMPVGNTSYQIIDNITLDDPRLVGLEGQISELKKVVQYITNPDVYDRGGMGPDKGILLAGPTRNGKTFLARALCGTINEVLRKKGISTRFSFKELKWGEIRWSSEGIKTIMEEAKNNAPCIIFGDELHTLPLQTKEGGETLMEFLTGMSGINSENDYKHQVIFLAATNQPEMLDSALLQPGRFGTIINFEKPGYQNRKKYFEISFKHNSIDATDIDIESLVRQTEGCSYGDLEKVVKSARFLARSLAKGMTQEHLQDRIDAHIHRFKTDVSLTSLEKKHLSVHQSGHALMHLLLDSDEKLEFVTIRGRWRKIKEGRIFDQATRAKLHEGKNFKYGAVVTYSDAESVKIKSNEERIKLAKIKLAGPIAEQILLGSPGYISLDEKHKRTFHSDDRKKALEYIKSTLYNGLDKSDLPKSVIEQLDLEAYELLKKCEQETSDILTSNRRIIEKVSDELSQKYTLTRNQIKKLMETS